MALATMNEIVEKVVMMAARAVVVAMTAASKKKVAALTTMTINHSGIRRPTTLPRRSRQLVSKRNRGRFGALSHRGTIAVDMTISRVMMVTVGIETKDMDAVTAASDTGGGDNGESDDGQHSGEGGDDGGKGGSGGDDSGI